METEQTKKLLTKLRDAMLKIEEAAESEIKCSED